MVLTSTDIKYLQTAFNKLVQWAINNEMQINKEKTVTMTFRKGGRAAANDVIHFGAETLTMVPHFKYLGVTLQTHGNTFTKHIKDRASTALIAMHDIKNITRLSLETAMKLFNLKISPIMTYGIDLIWEHLNKDNLQDIERIKASFLKKALGLSKFTPSRITYLLSKEPFYLEELRLQRLLTATGPYKTVMQEMEAKRTEIWQDLYSTDAMMNEEWKKAEYELRHVVTRFAAHGFHHKFCCTDKFHQPSDDCICKLCTRKCERYHAKSCESRTVSLTKLDEL